MPYIERMARPLVAGDVEVPLLEVVRHAGERGIDQPEASDVHIVVLVGLQVESLHVLKKYSTAIIAL